MFVKLLALNRGEQHDQLELYRSVYCVCPLHTTPKQATNDKQAIKIILNYTTITTIIHWYSSVKPSIDQSVIGSNQKSSRKQHVCRIRFGALHSQQQQRLFFNQISPNKTLSKISFNNARRDSNGFQCQGINLEIRREIYKGRPRFDFNENEFTNTELKWDYGSTAKQFSKQHP